ncbi:MAG: hypothetical protein KQH63_20930 [Desulfobulbaceae bacterium]|nr:hypothetical protein [Desulfobulbaceae bacterium]
MKIHAKLDDTSKAGYAWQFLSLLLGFICIGATLYYIFITYRYYFHSDSAIKNLLAQEILQTGQLFPKTWYYGNGDIWGLYSHILILPLLLFFNNGYFVHAASSAIFVLLLLCALTFFTYSLRKNFNVLLLFIIIFFSGFSPWMAENLFGQVAYGYAWGTLFSFIIWALLAVSLNSPTNVKPHAGLFFIFVIITCSGLRFVVDIYMPLVASLLIISCLQYFNEKIQVVNQKTLLCILLSCSIGCALGLLANHFLKQHVNFLNIANTIVLVDYERLVANFKLLFLGYLFSSGVNLVPPSIYDMYTLYNSSVNSAAGVEALYRTCLFGSVYFLPIFLMFRLFRLQSPILIIINISYVVHLLLTSFLYLTSSGLAVNVCTSRYFFLVQITAFVIALLYLTELSEKYGKKILHFSLLALLPLVLFNLNFLVFDAYSSDSTGSHLKHNKKEEIARFLADNQLKFGYAGFWNAYSTQILSDSKVKINAVDFQDDIVLPYRVLASERWYQGNSYNGPSFLLMTEEEYEQVQDFLDTKLGSPANKYLFRNFIITAYSFNIADKLQKRWRDFALNEELDKKNRKVFIEGESQYTADEGDKILITAKVTNTGNRIISSTGTYPVNLGGHLLTKGGYTMNYDFLRIHFPYYLEPGQSVTVKKELHFGAPGKFVIELDGVQEGVAWFQSPLKISVTIK